MTIARRAESAERLAARPSARSSGALSDAVIGAGVGAIVGSSLPSQPSVVYERPVVVGEALPNTITVYTVPRYRDYDYAIVNNHRVIIDPHTRRVVRVIEE